MHESQKQSNASWDASFNAFAASQVAELEAPAPEFNDSLSRALPLAGLSSSESIQRAVWETYGLGHSLRFWVWLTVVGAAAVYGLIAGWTWWWPAILLGVVALLLLVAVYLPWRLVRHVRATEPDRLCRGNVTEESLAYECQAPDGQWVASMSGDAVVPWSELRLLKLGSDYLFFLRRKGEQRWVFSLPRQLFRDEHDWNEMVEFADARLAHSLFAPRCRKCRKRLAGSALRPMPLAVRWLGDQPFALLGFLFGVPVARYCSGCWRAVYLQQLLFTVAFLVLIVGLVASIAYMAMK
jgi:hypothetical protein